ncbi:GNAT family N-acetyltransferase [Streptomyces sp. NPDC057362]|uniref:GNAT family N-acetyltransferase n=1 Tax=Streptomyces sp. NPDC057362 TaxID=3346106 RepID=UPI003629CDE5
MTPHQQNRTAARPGTGFVESLSEIGEDELSRLHTGRSFYVSRPWLRAVERLRSPDVAYVTHRDADSVLDGVLPLYRQRPSASSPYDAFGTFLQHAGGFRAADWSPSLLVGQSSAYSNEFLTAPTPDAQAVLQEMLHAADDKRREWGMSALAALYLNESGVRQISGIEGMSASLVCDVECEIDITFDSWEAYTRSLGKKRGWLVRREARLFQEAGYRVSGQRLSELLDTSNDLFTKLQQKYGDNTSQEERAHYLRVLADETDDHSRLFVMRCGDDVLGVCLTFLWQDTMYVRQLGLDYERLAGVGEYFNLAIYEPIRHAIEHGFTRVHFGRSVYDGKMFRGAAARPLLGACWSAAAGPPDTLPAFQDWNADRAKSATSGDRSLIMAAFGSGQT